jgi:hypothetical protein
MKVVIKDKRVKVFFVLAGLLILLSSVTPHKAFSQISGADGMFSSAANNTNQSALSGVGSGVGDFSQFFHIGEPFGGRITGEVKCSSSCGTPHKMLFIYDFRTNGLLRLNIEDGKSKLWHYIQNFTTGHYTVGTYTSGASCQVRAGDSCIELYPHGYINRGPGAGASGPLY